MPSQTKGRCRGCRCRLTLGAPRSPFRPAGDQVVAEREEGEEAAQAPLPVTVAAVVVALRAGTEFYESAADHASTSPQDSIECTLAGLYVVSGDGADEDANEARVAVHALEAPGGYTLLYRR